MTPSIASRNRSSNGSGAASARRSANTSKNNPEHASDIRELFPALVEVEQLKSAGTSDSIVPGGKRLTLSRLGDYQILGIVGEGGMGIVYEAIRESLRSRVALKIIHPRFRENAGYLRRFHVEACAAASLHHTNIVSVFDYGETDGVVYYAMPHIAGQSLDKVLRTCDESGAINRAIRPRSSAGKDRRDIVGDAAHSEPGPIHLVSIRRTRSGIQSPAGC